MSTQPYMPGFEGEQRRRDLSQFYTPPELAERVWRWMRPAYSPAPLRVLEPSAGRGALISPLFTLSIPVAKLVAYEVDPVNVDALNTLLAPTGLDFEVRFADFTADAAPGSFDLAVINTPYEDGQDVDFAERCCRVCTWVGGIFPAGILYSDARAAFWRWHDIRRAAYLSKRPHFGGEYSAQTDFCVLDLARRTTARKQGEASTTSTEWW